MLLRSFFPSLSFERSLSRLSALCVPVCLQTPLLRSLLLPFSTLPVSFGRSLCKISTLCLPICLQRCLSDIYPYVGSPLSVSPSVFRDQLLGSPLLLFFSLPLSLSSKRSLFRISALCLSICLQRCLCSCSFPLFPSLTLKRSLCRFSTLLFLHSLLAALASHFRAH